MLLLEQIDDLELTKLCQQGNAGGFSELYRRYNKAIFNSILRLVVDFAQAEDLLQEVFITLYQEIMKGYQILHFGGFSKRIAINKSISFLRQNKRALVFEDYCENIMDEHVENENHFDLRVEEVKKAINSLPDGFKTVVNLYVIEDLSQ